jgi:hypothetical protein
MPEIGEDFGLSLALVAWAFKQTNGCERYLNDGFGLNMSFNLLPIPIVSEK